MATAHAHDMSSPLGKVLRSSPSVRPAERWYQAAHAIIAALSVQYLTEGQDTLAPASPNRCVWPG